MNNNLEEAICYFKENEGYKRLFKAIKEKYISLGEIKGNVVINKPAVSEKNALSGLMKKDYSRNISISINLKKLQQRLDKSKYSGIQLEDILNNYFNEDILTKKEKIQNKNNELDAFWKDILEENKNTYMYDILSKSKEKKDNLYKTIKRYYEDNKEIMRNELLNACKGINYLNDKEIKERVRIPVFAAEIASNPHAFDKKTLCGKLFIQLLCYINDLQYPKNNEELAELYYNNKLLVDDVSNMVLCKNIVGFKKVSEIEKGISKETKYEEHKGLEGFDNYNEPVYLTMYNLSNIGSIKKGKYNKVLITENPAVFMEIMKDKNLNDFPLICTYGQVKLAGIMLMDLLVENNYKLLYSGDIDPEGIQIADKLKQRYKEKMILIGFNKETYYKNMSEVEISESRLKKLKSVKSLELKEICGEILKNKKASYEEKNINYIIKNCYNSRPIII